MAAFISSIDDLTCDPFGAINIFIYVYIYNRYKTLHVILAKMR